jgi:hypothetical protein
MRPIADVHLPAHIVEEDIPEIDDARVKEKAERYYYRSFHGAYKGHYKGFLTGLVGGAVIATGVGLIAAALLTGPLGIFGAAAFWGITAAFSAAGMGLGFHAYSNAGTIAGAKASSLAEKHARQLVKSKLISKGKGVAAPEDEFDEPSFEGRYKHHYEVPPDRDSGMFWHWKTGTIGAAIGTGLGAVIGFGAPAVITAFATEIAHIGAAFAATSIAQTLGITAAGMTAATAGIAAAPVLVGAVALGLVGVSFGINRSIFKSWFNVIDGWAKGKPGGIELKTVEQELAQARTPEEREQIMVREKAIYETALRRQDMIYDLDKKYYDKIFWNSIGGMFNGYAGGSILGMTIGAALGVGAAVLLAPMLGGISLGALAFPMMMGMAVAGGHMGAETFSSAGANAGAEAMSKALDEEFQRGKVLNEQGKTPVIKKPEPSKGIINVKTMAICATVGAVVGLAMFAGVFAAGFGLAKALIGSHISIGAATALATGIGGIIGSLYGIKAKVFQGFSNIANNLYDGKLFGTDGTEHAKEHEKVKVPETSMARVGSRGALEDITPDDVAAMNARMPQAQNISQVGRLGQQASMMQNPLLAQR